MPFSFLPSHALDGALDGPCLHVAKGARGDKFLLGVRLNPMIQQTSDLVTHLDATTFTAFC
jgi:hypothetical protein